MNYRFLFTLFAIAAPLVAGGYAPIGQYAPHGPGSLDELVNAASGGNPNVAQSITGNAEAQPSPAEAARLGQVSAQIGTLNSNPTYNNLRNSDNIAESLAESSLASNIRQGNVNIVSPNVVDQDIHRSLLVPSGPNNHQVIATQPLPPIVVTQPGAPPAQVSSGPAAVVKAAPVIYKIKPSVIFQQEVINKVPTPLSLNPVYVKVYKPGKQIAAPVAPVLQQSAYGAGAGHGAGVAGAADAAIAGVSGVGAGVYGNAGPTLAYTSQAAPAASAYSNQGSSAYGNHGSSAYGNPGASAYASPVAPVYASQPVAPVYASQPAAPGYNSPVANAYGSPAVGPAYPQANY